MRKKQYIDPMVMMKLDAARGINNSSLRPTIQQYNDAVKSGTIVGQPIGQVTK